METEKPDAEPQRETAHTDEKGGESQPHEAAPLSVAEPAHSEAEERDAEEVKDETDREQDEAIDELAENTKLIAQQTKWEKMQAQWVRNQFWASLALGLLTLYVLYYQATTMSDQLASMQSSSNQTQEMIGAMQKQANASVDTANATKSFAEQQKGLVESAGKQANASVTQANASLGQVEIAKQSLGAAQSSARAAEQSVQVTKDALRMGERPSIGITGISMVEFVAGKRGYAKLAYVNTGRTPARHATVLSTMVITPVAEAEANFKFSNNIIGITSRSSVAVNATRFAHAFTDQPLSANEIKEVEDEKKWAFVYSLVEYDNGRGDNYFTQYCGRYIPALKVFGECPIFNDSN